MSSGLSIQQIERAIDKAFSFFPYDQTYQIFSLSKSFQVALKSQFQILDSKYIHHYNIDSRKKLIDITSIISSDAQTFPTYQTNSIDNIAYPIAYGRIMNKILKMNRIIVFKYEITQQTNLLQLTSIISQLTYPKSLIISIKDEDLLTDFAFHTLIDCAKTQESILEFCIKFRNINYFSFIKKIKRINVFQKEKQSLRFLHFQNLFYNHYKDIVENVWMSYQDFEQINDNENKLEYVCPDTFELNLAFDKDHTKELEYCLNYIKTKVKCHTAKILLFQTPDFSIVNQFITFLQPRHLTLTPYKDIHGDVCSSFLKSLNSFKLETLNIINLVEFNTKTLEDFLTYQTDLKDLRITGMLTEEHMKLILNFYCNNQGKYSLKYLSINGQIEMNKEWCDLLCSVLTNNKQLELLHVDCLFNEREYMTPVAEAFYSNSTLTSFTVRNSVRLKKDEFIDVLKELLYDKEVPRPDVFKRLKLYKII